MARPGLPRKIAAVSITAIFLFAARVAAQPPVGFSTNFELSSAIQLDEADGESLAHLEQARAFLADGQWDEFTETLRRVMELYGDKVIELDHVRDRRDAEFKRYISVRDYCHFRLAAISGKAPEALALYRRRVDPLAGRRFQQGIASRDAEVLQRVVHESFTSGYGDDALYALGELALERGDYSAARSAWERISPMLRSPGGRPLGLELTLDDVTSRWDEVAAWYHKREGSPSWLAYPDTNLDLDAVRARLVLTSILEGSTARAEIELEIFKRLAPGAKGHMAGREVVFADFLSGLLQKSKAWPPRKPPRDWSTFAGTNRRSRIVSKGLDIVPQPIWSIELGRPLLATFPMNIGYGVEGRRVAEDYEGLLSYHPVIVDGLLFVSDRRTIRAFDAKTGQPKWIDGGVVYEPKNQPFDVAANRGEGRLGTPRFTLTALGDKLFARMGSGVTSRPTGASLVEPGYLVGLDLKTQGKVLWEPIKPDGDDWSFEGTPITDGTNLYVGMRRSEVSPHAHVACFDLQKGQLRWRRMIVSADTPGHGQVQEVTGNLLTLQSGTLYYNTNLGVVAALHAADGAIQWITAYPRATRGNLNQRAAHFYRDLNPCVFHGGTLLVGPSDSPTVFALDATTGQMIWRSHLSDDAVHMLGVGGGNLIASGDRLWWMDVQTGKVKRRFPDLGVSVAGHASPSPRGFGRGILADDHVYWPTRDGIYVFDQKTTQHRRTIDFTTGLTPSEVTGGNLLIQDRHLYIATSDRLFAFNEHGITEKQENE